MLEALEKDQCGQIMSKSKNGMRYLKKRQGPRVLQGVLKAYKDSVVCFIE